MVDASGTSCIVESPTGVTVVILQHRETGCMNMVHHFFGHRFELRRTADNFLAKHGDRYDVVTMLDHAHVGTPRLGDGLCGRGVHAELARSEDRAYQARCGSISANTFHYTRWRLPHSRASRLSHDSPTTTRRRSLNHVIVETLVPSRCNNTRVQEQVYIQPVS